VAVLLPIGRNNARTGDGPQDLTARSSSADAQSTARCSLTSCRKVTPCDLAKPRTRFVTLVHNVEESSPC